jgi:hypothetical protein
MVSMNTVRLAIDAGLCLALGSVVGCSSDPGTQKVTGSTTGAGGSTTSSSASSSSSGASGGADGGVAACSGPPVLSSPEFLPTYATPCPVQEISVYGDQIACEGIGVTVGGVSAPIVSYMATAGAIMPPPPGITVSMPAGVLPSPDAGETPVKIVVTSAFGSATSTQSLKVVPAKCP